MTPKHAYFQRKKLFCTPKCLFLKIGMFFVLKIVTSFNTIFKQYRFIIMKTYYVIIALVGLLCNAPNSAYAQAPSLTAAGNPTIGTSTTLFTTAINSITNPGASGANITWDFGNIAATGSQKVDFTNSTETPYGAQFPNTIAVAYTDNLQLPSATISYEFWNSQGIALNRKGLANPLGITVDYTDSKQMLSFPFTYNNTFNDTFSANYIAQGTNVSEVGNRTILADGYGTLVLPYGTINNVLRVRTTENYTQTIPSFPNPLNYTVETYSWYQANWNFPIFTIITEELDVSPQAVSVAYFTQFVPTGNNTVAQNNVSLNAFPNPTADIATIRFNLPTAAQVKLSLYSPMGQLIDVLADDQLNGQQAIRVDLANYPRGIYIAELNVDGNKQMVRIVVQ